MEDKTGAEIFSEHGRVGRWLLKNLVKIDKKVMVGGGNGGRMCWGGHGTGRDWYTFQGSLLFMLGVVG